MYPVSEAFLQAVQGNTRKYYWTGEITTKGGAVYAFGLGDIVKGSGYITRQCCGNSEIELGTVYAAEMGITLLSDIDRYTLEDAVVTLTYHLRLANGTYEEVPMGVFEVSEANRTVKCLELKAYDYMLRFDKSFNGYESAGTAYELIALCCKACSVELANTRAEIDAMPNGAEILSIYIENDIETYRDVLYYVAQVLGGFWVINRVGQLELHRYGTEPVMSVGIRQRFSSSFSDFITRYTAVSSTNKRTETAEYYALDPDDALTMNLGVNPLLQFGLEETREQLCRNILNDIAVIDYVPFDSDTIGNPALDLGDVLTFSGGQADETQITCVTSIQTKIGGKQTLKCVGKNPRLAAAKSKNDKNISGLLNQIEEQGKSGKLGIHTFTNAAAYTVNEARIKVISIEFASSEENHMEFFGQVMIEAKADAVTRSAEAKGTIVVPVPVTCTCEPGGSGGEEGSGSGETGSGMDSGGTDTGTATAASDGSSDAEDVSVVADDGTSDAGDSGTDSGTGDTGSTTETVDVTVDVSLPVTWTEDGQAVCQVVYELNDEEIPIFQPVETWHSGRHLLTLYYPIEKIVANYVNTFNVYLSMTGGTGTIEEGGIIASISGQAMAAEEAWDGKLYPEDTVSRFAIGGALTARGYAKGYSESLDMLVQEFIDRSYVETFATRYPISAFGTPIEME